MIYNIQKREDFGLKKVWSLFLMDKYRHNRLTPQRLQENYVKFSTIKETIIYITVYASEIIEKYVNQEPIHTTHFPG